MDISPINMDSIIYLAQQIKNMILGIQWFYKMFLKISLKGLYFLFESTFDPENFISVSKIFHPLLLETEKTDYVI